MQYSPKLKKAIAEIKEIVDKYDVAAFVLLHEPSGFAEFLNKADPSWSAIKPLQNGIRVRLKQAEVGKQKAREMADATYNMVVHFDDMLSMHAKLYAHMKKVLKEQWGGDDGEGLLTSHNQQNS